VEGFNDLIDAFVPWDVTDWDCCEDGWIFSYAEAKVGIMNHFDEETFVISVSNGHLRCEVVHPIRKDLQYMLHTESAKVDGIVDFATLILRLLEATSAYLLAWRDAVRLTKLGLRENSKAWQHGWDASFITDWESIMDNSFGLNLDSVADTAHHILGMTPKDICAGVPKEFRILHVKSIMRKDLADRLLKRQATAQKVLLGRPLDELWACVPRQGGKRVFLDRRKEDLVETLVKPRLTFHGTMRQFVGSIVRYGFVTPGRRIGGTDKAVDIRCGATYGQGIYSSPDVSFSLSYLSALGTAVQKSDGPSVRIIAYTTIMGRAATLTKDDNWSAYGHPFSGADSRRQQRVRVYRFRRCSDSPLLCYPPGLRF
jgi:hypothetical protein